MRSALPLLLVAGAMLSGFARGEAQFIQVTGIQGVDFGGMVPGISRVVSRTDALSAARFDIKGAGSGRTVELRFSLPAALTGPGGASLPLSYTAGDAGFSAQQSIGGQTGFDPRIPFVATLSASGRGSVFLGCRATPAANQPPGTYSATLTLSVSYVL
jgi:hypothetical protein